MVRVRIAGTGSYLPALEVTNDDLAGIVETSHDWIVTRSGIVSRHYTTGEPTWQMGVEAARQALADRDPAELGLIVVTTVTPDYMTPSTASIVQAELRAERAFCFDLNAGCTGFVYALDLAARYLASAPFRYALVVSAETLTKQTDFTDRKTAVLFGDGAGAVLLEHTPEGEASALLGVHHGGPLEGADYLVGEAFGVRHPFLEGEPPAARFPQHQAGICFSMSGRDVYRFAVQALPEAVAGAVREAGLTLSDIDLVVPHQANSRIVQAAAKRLGLPAEKMIDRIEHLGNTSSATIPIVLAALDREGRLQRGMNLVFAGFGGGLCYGAVALKY